MKGDEVTEEEESELTYTNELEKEMANLTLCLLSKCDKETDHTMRVLGYYKKRKLNILIHTSKFYNFINKHLAKV